MIEGERRHEDTVEKDAYYRMEASYGAFERRIPIPDGVDDDEIGATYVDGVLEVVVPAAETAVPEPAHRQIPVKTPKAVRAA